MYSVWTQENTGHAKHCSWISFYAAVPLMINCGGFCTLSLRDNKPTGKNSIFIALSSVNSIPLKTDILWNWEFIHRAMRKPISNKVDG